MSQPPPYPPYGQPPSAPPPPPHGHGQWSPAPPPPKRRRWPLIAGGVVLLLVIIGLANGGGSQTAAPAASPAPVTEVAAPAQAGPTPTPQTASAPATPEPETDQITYEVTGDGVSKANNITYVKDSSFGQQQENGETLPWSTTVEFDNGLFDVQPLSLIAQSGSGGSGSITCRILRNGEEVTSSTSSGPYAVVTCAGGPG